MENDKQEDRFSFPTKREYEDALVKLVQSGDDERYEALVEEYIRFCNLEKDA